MPEARDRLAQVEDLMVVYSPRRPEPESHSGDRGIQILADDDESEELRLARLPFRWGDIPLTGARGQIGVAGIRRSGGFGTSRYGRGRNMYGSPSTPTGRENMFPVRGRSRARGRGSALPSWYPRTPLRDISAVMRAIERRRARLGEDLGQSPPLAREVTVLNPSASSTSDAHLEHQEDESIVTPHPIARGKLFPLSGTKVPKILLDISTNEDNEESGFLTPQKKLLNSIDTVEKVVMEELRKLKRTPTAKKAEREKRVRTLMSMR